MLLSGKLPSSLHYVFVSRVRHHYRRADPPFTFSSELRGEPFGLCVFKEGHQKANKIDVYLHRTLN